MKKLFASIVSLIVLIAAVLVYRGLSDVFFQQPEKDAVAISFAVPQGATLSSITTSLVDQNIIETPRLFEWYVRMKGAASKLNAGTFTFKEGMNHADVLAQLVGDVFAEEITVTIPEGYRIQQMGDVIATQLPGVSESDWTDAVLHPNRFEEEFPFLRGIPSGHGMEGYVFPDTYRFRADASAEEVVRRMLGTFEERLTSIGLNPTADNVAQGLSLHEFVTLASVVEREVRQLETMKNVADIFLKRLEIGMALQADSTVNYITGGKDPAVSLEATKIDSPYNTYKYAGLPPGPIASPGLNALTAVAQPISNPYFYFLTSEAGSVHYAETFDQHVANKHRYLR